MPSIMHINVQNGQSFGYVVAAVNALLGLVIAFGITISPEQQAAIIGFVNAALVAIVHVVKMPTEEEHAEKKASDK